MAPKRPRPRSVGDIRLRVVRGPREDGRWYWRAGVYGAGDERTVWTGWATPTEADAAVASIVVQGRTHAPREPDRADTVRDLLEFYLARQEGRADIKPITVRALRVMLVRVSRSIGDVKLERLDGAVLERHRDERLRAGGAPATICAELVRLRAAWTWGQEVGLAPMRRLPMVSTPKWTRYNRHTPARKDIRAVLAHLQTWQRAIVLLYAATGARLGELADLRWVDVDLQRATIRVTGKTGPRDVPLSPPALAMLQEWKAHARPGDRVWGVTRATVAGDMWPALTAACDAAGVPRFTAQGLRRAVVDALYTSGADVGAAAAIVGHSPAVALAAYRKATAEQRVDAVDRARLGDFEDTPRRRSRRVWRTYTPSQRTVTTTPKRTDDAD